MVEYIVQVFSNGDRKWWSNDKLHKLHREDRLAIEYISGDKTWYLNGKLHREDGPAIEKGNGDKEWYINGKLHREDGPAIEYVNGDKEWYVNGKKPTIEYINGKLYREKEFLNKTETIELTVADIEKLLNKKIKIVKEN